MKILINSTILLSVVLVLSCTHTTNTEKNKITKKPKREIKLAGTYNFRDIGGYKTKDNKSIKWGKIYRSAKLTDLTSEDLIKLASLNIARIADLRSPAEIKFFPDKIPVKAKYFRVNKEIYTGDLTKDKVEDDWAAMANDMKQYTSQDTDESIIKYYKGLAHTFKDRYKEVFDSLLVLSSDSALVLHCTGGKDRSGVVTAMIEYVLGVDSAQIADDFVLTNKYRYDYNAKIANMLHEKYNVPMERASDYGISKAIYLQATFDEMRKQFGSLDNYVVSELGVDQTKKNILRQKYLD